MSKILMLNIATNKYVRYIDKLYEDVEKYFLTDHDVSFLLFTNHTDLPKRNKVKYSYVEHKPFPEPTLKRYNYFMQERDYIEQFDYVFYSDVDMGFIAPVGDDVLGELCLTKHVLSYQTRDCNYWSYDRNPNSTAYVPFGDGVNYYAGGFNGGSSKTFMKMAETISKNVLADEERGIVAEWHDESHMNRYAIDNPPDNILPLAYCCPDWKDKLDFEKIQPKILALNKDHQEIRSD